MSVNKVTLLGYSGKDPDFKEFENGGCIATLSLATTKKGFKTKEGKEIPDKTEWHNVVFQNVWAKLANKYVKKGDRLYIEGELRTRNYEDSQGVKRYVTEIFVTFMEMLTPKEKVNQTPPPPMPDAPTPDDDDLPF